MTQNISKNEEIIPKNKKGGILQPKNDVVFTALFSKGNEKITKALIENILDTKINKIELDKSRHLSSDNILDKRGILDLRAILNDDTECNIEVQLSTHDKMLERFLYYWSRIYTSTLKTGNEYSKLRRTISIIIVGDDVPHFKDIPKALTKWQIREEDYLQKLLTPYFQICIIELRKAIKAYENDKDNKMLQWMLFLDNPEDKEVYQIMEKNEDIKKAKEELDRLSEERFLERMAIKAEIDRMDYNQGMYDARRHGIEDGVKIQSRQLTG